MRPRFDVDAYERIYQAHAHLRRKVAREYAAKNPRAYVFIDKPFTHKESGLELMGDVAGDTIVVHEKTGHSMPLSEVPRGHKVHAFDRDDAHASGQVWQSEKGVLCYTDHTLGVIWHVLAGRELEWARAHDRAPDPQPEDPSNLFVSLQRYANEHWPNVRVERLPSVGFVELDDFEGLTILRAPHGTGKTVWAAELIRRAEKAITVANTSALAEHNAARFDISCYQEKEEAALKISTTINSLPKIKLEKVDVFHVDEADQVHGYLHSGTMDRPVVNMHAMLDRLAEARYGIVSSADLDFEDICFFIEAYRMRAAGKPIRIVEKPPTPNKRNVRLTSLGRVKAEFDDAFTAHAGGSPIALGWTARREVAAAAWGYAMRREDRRVFWVSGENSRFNETIERFRGRWRDRLVDTADFLDAADVFFFSPALQSGVSLEQPVDRVFLLHTKRDFAPETVAQMIMRFRACTNVVWGVCDFEPVYVRTDDRYLEAVCVGLADETDRQLQQALPEYTGEFPKCRAVDTEFALSWRITQRKLRRAYGDPLQRLREVIDIHAWTLEIDQRPGNPEGFNSTKNAARDVRDLAVRGSIVVAPNIDDEEARRIDKAHVHYRDDRQKLERKRIADFYGLREITIEAVERDRRGKFRAQCRNYAWLWLLLNDRESLAWLDHRQSKGRQPSEYPHLVQKTDLLRELHDHVFEHPLELVEELPFEVLERRALEFTHVRARYWSGLFLRSVTLDPEKISSWFNAEMKRLGAEVSKSTSSCFYEFTEVHEWSLAYRQKVQRDAIDAERHAKVMVAQRSA